MRGERLEILRRQSLFFSANGFPILKAFKLNVGVSWPQREPIEAAPEAFTHSFENHFLNAQGIGDWGVKIETKFSVTNIYMKPTMRQVPF